MRLLLDECVTRKLKGDLAGHDVRTVAEAGYDGLKNGVLLRAASGNFDVLITVDRNLPFQQNIQTLQLGIIILATRGIRYEYLKSLTPMILQALTMLNAGEFIYIDAAE